MRMRKEPMVYGMSHDEPRDDPQLGNKRNELIVQAARQLSTAKMIRYDEINNSFAISDLGRIAAKYYLKYQTNEIFSKCSLDVSSDSYRKGMQLTVQISSSIPR